MSARKTLLAALIAAIVAPAGAQAMLADIPLEIIAARSELIVVVRVTDAKQPVKLKMDLPDSPKAVTAWFGKYKLSVTRVIAENGKPPAPAAAKPPARSIHVFTQTPRPQPPVRPKIMVSDAYFASLKVGQSYILILRAMPGKPEYYLPSYPKNYRPARPDDIAKIEKAADVSKWPWGKAVGGLEIALAPTRTTVHLRQVTRSVRGPDGKFRRQFKGLSAYLTLVIALRNVTKAPINVSLYQEDKFLAVTARGPGNKVIKADLYGYLATGGRRVVPVGPRHTTTIAPGQLVFIHSGGGGATTERH
ncbi:MAG: hypothetical protein QGG42_10775 [Phycisphaerae bacterium]|nr:hypothetical protein [Phycisphaerae bacterium]